MSTPQVVDTNVILRYLLADHPEHYQQATVLMESVKQGTTRLYLAETVLTECTFVLQKFYKIPREQISRELIALLDYSGMETDHPDAHRLALKVFGGNYSVPHAN